MGMQTFLGNAVTDKGAKLTRDALAVVDQFNKSLLTKGHTRLPSYEPLIAYLQHVVPAPGFPTPMPLELITFALIEIATMYGLPSPIIEVHDGDTIEDLGKRLLNDLNTRTKSLN
jgi:hypothetical protein